MTGLQCTPVPFSSQSNMGPNSTRLHIIKLQNTDPEGKRLLDAGITRDKLGNRAGTDLVGHRPVGHASLPTLAHTHLPVSHLPRCADPVPVCRPRPWHG